MSKLRKGVKKQKKRSQQRAVPSKDIKAKLQAGSDYKRRDIFLYKSALKSYAIAALLLILAIWTNGNFPPFDELPDIPHQLLNGAVSLVFFFFVLVSWGNALEIRGNVLEWKHIIFLLIAVSFIAAWGGLICFFMTLFGAFAMLTFLWYLNR